MQRETEYNEALNKDTKISLHKGRKPNYNNIEQILINFIEFNRKALNPIITWCIAIEMFRIIPVVKKIRYKSLLQWIYIFLKRHNYTFRRHTHLGQSLPQESFDIIAQFVSKCYNSRFPMKYDDDVIDNMDETLLTLNIPPNYVIEKKGNKNIIIRTQNQEKCRLSVLLTILSNGLKLPPLLIFKSAKNGNLYNELANNINVKKGRIIITFNQKVRCTKEVMELWNKKIWLNIWIHLVIWYLIY